MKPSGTRLTTSRLIQQRAASTIRTAETRYPHRFPMVNLERWDTRGTE
jgi:hypothetical protein